MEENKDKIIYPNFPKTKEEFDKLYAKTTWLKFDDFQSELLWQGKITFEEFLHNINNNVKRRN